MDQHLTYPSILPEVIDIARKAGRYIKDELGQVTNTDIEEKELNSLVSYVDKHAEEYIVNHLKPVYPDAGFITEEDSIDNIERETSWIIDPLDGTTNFLKGVPYFSVSIGLKYRDQIVLGVVYDIYNDEVFHAVRGQGAYHQSRKLELVSKPLSEVLVATGFPYGNGYDSGLFLNVIQGLLGHTRGIRRMGSAALDLCYVASNRFGAYYESRLNPWDVAAGSIIVEEAGGVISNFSGDTGYNDGRSIIACHSDNLAPLLDLIKPLLSQVK